MNPLLSIDPINETDRIINLLEETVHKRMHRFGAVVGISGGIDSAVTLALCVRAFGPEHVLAVMLPEKESNQNTSDISQKLADFYGVKSEYKDITPILTSLECYQNKDEAIRRLFPVFAPEAGYKCKISLPNNLLEGDELNFFILTIFDPDGREKSLRLPYKEYLQIVAATNMKQRSRMVCLYFYAEFNNYAVIGTTNKNEYELGFFVKYGDGGVDVEPIAHLYKTQVYQLAEYLNVPEEIRNRPPTTDTYSAGGTQEEFFYRLPFELLDTIMIAQENNLSFKSTAELSGLTEIQVQRVVDDIQQKKRSTDFIRMEPVRM